MDEKIPHIHCVVFSLIKELIVSDTLYLKNNLLGTNFIYKNYKINIILDWFQSDMTLKKVDREHLSIKGFKKDNKILEQKINIRNEIFDKVKEYSKDRHKVSVYFETGKLSSKAGKEYGKSIIK